MILRIVRIIGFLVWGNCFLVGQGNISSITGHVTDAEGRPLPGVEVKCVSPNLVGKALATTNARGVYRLLSLAPGEYKLTFSLAGFQTLVRERIRITQQQTIEINTVLHFENLEDYPLSIVTHVPVSDVTNPAWSKEMSREYFHMLPMGRTSDSIPLLFPGVLQEPLLAGTSIDGASGLENMYYVDGSDTTNLLIGWSGQAVSLDFIEEVQVTSSGYQAQYQGALGGTINIVTRYGGNEFHGEVMGFYNSYLTRTDWRDLLWFDYNDKHQAVYYTQEFLVGKDRESRFEGGFNLGGFIVRDKLWFFGSFLPVFQQNKRTVHHSRGGDKEWQRTETAWNWHLKLTSQPIKNLRLSASLVNNLWKYKGELTASYNDPNPTVSYDIYGFTFPNLSGNLSADLTLGNSFLASVRGGFFRMNKNHQLEQPPDGPYYQFMTPNGYGPTTNMNMPGIPDQYKREAGWSNYNGGNASVVKKQIDERYGINVDFTYYMKLAGAHSLRAGVQYIRQGQDYDITPKQPIVFLAWDRYFFNYESLVNYGRGTYGYYAVYNNDLTGPYGRYFQAYSNRWALFLQDSWTIKNKLTLNFGLRAESEYVPSYATGYPEFENLRPIKFDFGQKLAPRLGFVYDVKGNSSLKIFGSYGIFYDIFKLNEAANSFGGSKWKSAYYSLDTYEWDKIGKNNYFPGRLLLPNQTIDFRKPSFECVDPDLKPMSNREFSFGIEKKLMENLKLSARLVQKHLRYAIENIFFWPIDTGYLICNPGYGWSLPTTKGGRLDPGYWETPKAKREYWGINVTLDKTFSWSWMAGISYTWSRLTGNYSGLAYCNENKWVPPNISSNFRLWYLPYDRYGNKIDGSLPTDRPHVFKAYGTYAFPFGLTVGLVLNAMSGTPVSTAYSADYSPGYLPEGRGNLGRTPFLWFANAYLEYNLKLGKNSLSLNLNIDNLFDTRTATRIYPFYIQNWIPLNDEVRLGKNWNIDDYHPILDPRYKMKMDYYGTRGDSTSGFDGIGTPLSARFGVRFSF